MNVIQVIPVANLHDAGVRLAKLRDRLDDLDEEVGLVVDGLVPRGESEWDFVYDELWRLGGEAMGMRPVTLENAGTLALCISQHISYLDEHEVEREDAEPFYRKISTAIAGILLALRNAGVSLEFGPEEADYEISRRDLPPAVPREADADLMRLCRRAVAAYDEERALVNAGADLAPGPDFDRIAALAQKQGENANRLAKRIALTPAKTLAGVRARAAVVRAAMPVDHAIGDSIPIDWHKGMLDALLRDMEEGGH